MIPSRLKRPAAEADAAPAQPPEAASMALANLEADRAAANAALEELGRRRALLLAEDASDAAIEVLDVEIARQRRRLERAEAATPGLRVRAEAERRAHLEADFADAYEAYRKAAADFLLAYRTAVETRGRLAAIVDAASLRFSGRAGAFCAFPREDLTLEPARLAAFEAEADEALTAEARRLKGEW